MKVFSTPVVFEEPAFQPKKLLSCPVVLFLPALKPTKVFTFPEGFIPLGVVDMPAPTPANVLELTKGPPPVMLNTSLPLIL